MAMSDCERCWETPCVCGHGYRDWSSERLIKQGTMLIDMAGRSGAGAVQTPVGTTKASDEADTWFLVMEVVPERGGGWFVLRADRATLPKATVVSGPHESEAAAEAVAAQMRETGTA